MNQISPIKKKAKKRRLVPLVIICVLLIFNLVFAIYLSGFDWHLENVLGGLVRPGSVALPEIEGAVSKADKAQDWDYFDNTVFVGDSITYGIASYGYLSFDHVFAKIGLHQGTALTSKCVYVSKTSGMTIADAVSRAKPGKIIVTLGVNALYGGYSDSFYDNYLTLIERMRRASPESVIIIQSVFPVSENWAQKNKPDASRRIADINERLATLAEDNNCYFLFTYEDMIDDNGYLLPELSGDGVHLSRAGYQTVFDYVLSHPVISNDTFTAIGAVRPPVSSSTVSQVSMPDLGTVSQAQNSSGSAQNDSSSASSVSDESSSVSSRGTSSNSSGKSSSGSSSGDSSSSLNSSSGHNSSSQMRSSSSATSSSAAPGSASSKIVTSAGNGV